MSRRISGLTVSEPGPFARAPPAVPVGIAVGVGHGEDNNGGAAKSKRPTTRRGMWKVFMTGDTDVGEEINGYDKEKAEGRRKCWGAQR